MNRLLTKDEMDKEFMAVIKNGARDLGVPEMAVAIVFGAMCGAPLSDADMQWAADEISKAAKEKA